MGYRGRYPSEGRVQHLPTEVSELRTICIASTDRQIHVDDLVRIKHRDVVYRGLNATGYRLRPEIEMRIKRFFNNRPAYVREQSFLRWDEKEVYGLRLRDFGNKKAPLYINLLAKVISDNKVKCDPKDSVLAQDLCEIYPWLRFEGGILSKASNLCNDKFGDKDIDVVARSLIDMIEKEPKDVNAVADNYLAKMEKRFDVKDKSDNKEKSAVRSPLIVLLASLAKAFPTRLEITNNSVRLIETTEPSLSFDRTLLRWICRIAAMKDPELFKALSEMLMDNPEGKPISVINDMAKASNIFFESLGRGDDYEIHYLYEKEPSEVDKEAIERHRFLQRAERVGRYILDVMKEEFSIIDEFLYAPDPQIIYMMESWQKMLSEEDVLDGKVKAELEKALQASELGSQRRARDAIKKKSVRSSTKRRRWV